MIPLRATNVQLASSWPDKIIIHHTACKVPDAAEFLLDRPKFQTGKLQNLIYRREKKDTNFHYIVESVGNDFQVIVSQPLMTLCEFPDIPKEDWNAVHIALMGNYNRDIPPNRLYKVMAYRVIVPIMRMFVLDFNNIYLHSSLSDNPEVTCPGEFVDLAKLKNQLQSVYRRKTVRRG